eukprot:11166733-Lingulodinium_polyedra.AAC.1
MAFRAKTAQRGNSRRATRGPDGPAAPTRLRPTHHDARALATAYKNTTIALPCARTPTHGHARSSDTNGAG